jgi:hypothetical protein
MTLKEYKNGNGRESVGRYCSSKLEHANLWEIKNKGWKEKILNIMEYRIELSRDQRVWRP